MAATNNVESFHSIFTRVWNVGRGFLAAFDIHEVGSPGGFLPVAFLQVAIQGQRLVGVLHHVALGQCKKVL